MHGPEELYNERIQMVVYEESYLHERIPLTLPPINIISIIEVIPHMNCLRQNN